MNPKRFFRSAFAISYSMAAWPLRAGTCALCREALRSGGSPGLLNGFYWSIILIGAIPLVVLALGVRYAWRNYKAR